MPLLEAHRVTKVFGGGLLMRRRTVALDGVSLAIGGARPSVVAIAGESGSGKTTLARLLLGMAPPTTGEIRYRGADLWTMPPRQWKVFRREVQAVFQDPFEVFNPFYRVDHVLAVPVKKFGLVAPGTPARAVMAEALRAVGLRPEETLGRYPHQLSGGQRQRVMVARAMLLRPRVILADEPVSMVDASLRATILESLLALHRDHGISLVYITHDLTTAYQVSEHIVILYRGTVAEAGSVERVIKAPQHPYTRLLVDSIPLASAERRWETQDAASRAADDDGDGRGTGCPFAARCPFVMDRCRREAPPLYRTDAQRAAACFLYDGAPVAESADVLAGTPPPSGRAGG